MLTSNIAVKGMNTDVLEKFQEEGTYRFALNAVLETSDGDIRGISNETGNTYCAINFPTTKKIIGHALTDTDDIILFLFDPLTLRPAHEIGSYNPNSCLYTSIAKGECLNFKLENQINAIFRVKDGCTKYLYFTDNLNPYRVVNLSDTKDWVSNGNIISCSKIKYSRDFKVPKVSGTNAGIYKTGVSDTGGSLPYGTYSFAVRLIDYDGNPTDWLNFTRYFPIGYGSQENLLDHKTYHAYTAGANVKEEIGYKPISNKSISLDVSNLDTEFKQYQVAVIKRTSISGAISGVDILEPKYILNPSNLPTITDSFVYTGNDSEINTQSSIEALFAETVKLDRVASHTQADNRLFVGGVKQTPKDYKGFQRHASSIKTQYATDPTGFPNEESKNASGYQEFSGFMHDEVYSFGIVYIFKDGEHSPVFHIPGRPKDITTAALARNPHIVDANPLDSHTLVGDANIIEPTINKRWQVYNTFTRDALDVTGYMGYYEVSNTYPTYNNTCDTHADGYWGRDFTGALVTGNIRHHRMPDFSAKPDTEIFYHRTCGVRFTMANDYPSSDIVGHYYVTGDRSGGDKTILDAGVINGPNGAGILNIELFQRIGISFTPNKDYIYLSNKTQFLEELPTGSYIKVQHNLPTQSFVQNYATATDVLRYGKTISPAVTSKIFVNGVPTNTNLANFNYKLLDSKLILKNNKYLDPQVPGSGLPGTTGDTVNTINGLNIKNDSNSINFGVLSLDRDIVDYGDTRILRASIKTLKDVFVNLYSIRYKKTSNNFVTKQTGTTLVTSIFAGDIISTTTMYAENKAYEATAGDIGMRYNAMSFLTESEINTSFVLSDDKYDGQYSIYKGGYTIENASADNLLEYLSSKLYKEGDAIGYHYETSIRSKAYDYYQPDKIYLSLPPDYDICSKCFDEDFPNRIYYSEPDTQEATQDFYRTIRPNNYKDLDGYIGRITDMFTFRDNLYVLTTNSCVYLPYRPQSIQTNEGGLYIGTGEVLSLPPKQLKTTDYAFGGTSHFKSRVLTEYGALYVDDISARPFLLNEGLSDLSLAGMRNFFQEEGYLTLVKQFNSKGITFPNYSTSSPIGVGYITTYEPRFKRAIIHKKDFKITDNYINLFASGTNITTINTLWWDGVRFVYNNELGVRSYPVLTDPLFFENKSFTVSYSFITNSFVSFHSYLPEYMFNNYRNIFSNSLYKHEGDYQRFYGRKYDFIVDYINVLNPKEIKTFSHVSIRNRTYYNGFKDTTFDRALIYNSHQTSGVMYLDKDKAFDLSPANLYTPIKTADDTYRISGIRDNTVSNANPIWDSSWNIKQFSYYIDKMPNIANIDINQSLFTRQRFKDYYLGLRLFYNPVKNEKIVVDIIDTEYSNRNR